MKYGTSQQRNLRQVFTNLFLIIILSSSFVISVYSFAVPFAEAYMASSRVTYEGVGAYTGQTFQAALLATGPDYVAAGDTFNVTGEVSCVGATYAGDVTVSGGLAGPVQNFPGSQTFSSCGSGWQSIGSVSITAPMTLGMHTRSVVVNASGFDATRTNSGSTYIATLQYEVVAAVPECSDGIDNDGDGFVDTADGGCSSGADTSERTGRACDDGIDNDGDGLTDWLEDPGCYGAFDRDEYNAPECSDGIDNDGDGLVDYSGDSTFQQTDSNYVATDGECATYGAPIMPSGYDISDFPGGVCTGDEGAQLDTRCDGGAGWHVVYTCVANTPDPGCSSASDTSETSSSPNLASIADIDFGSRTIGGGPYNIPVLIENTGGTDTTISVTGLSAPYQCVGAGCSGYSLAANDDVTVNIRYTPVAPAGVEPTQTATVTCTGGCSSQTFTVDGESDAAPPPTPTVTFDSPLTPSIGYGTTHTMSWTSTNAIDCDIRQVTDNVDFYNQGVSGPYTTGPLTSDKEYSVRCQNSSGVWSSWTTGADNVFVTVGNAAPTANAGANQTITQPTNAAAASGASASDPDGSVVSTVWSLHSGPGGGTIIDGNTLTPTFTNLSNPGTYKFILTVTDNEGATATDNMDVIVNMAPPVTNVEVSINGGSWVTTNPTISEGDTVAIRWDGGAEPTTTCTGTNVNTGGARSGQTSVTSPTPGNSTTYTVDCTNASGSDSDSITVTKQQLTDLTIEIVNYATSTSYDPATGNYDTVNVTLLVQNGPTAISDSFEIEVGIDRDGNTGPFVDTQSILISSMATSASQNLVVSFSDVPFAQAYVEAIADVDNDVVEVDEGNNADIEMVAELPPIVDMVLNIDPEDLVRGGENALLDWDTVAYFPMDCTMTGPTLSLPAWNPAGPPPAPAGSATAGPINAKSEFTLTCVEPRTGTTYIDSVSVETTGEIQEI